MRRLTHGYWEAKDIDDDLPAEVSRKLAAGYPRDNILFRTPQRAILGTLFERGLDPAKRAQLACHKRNIRTRQRPFHTFMQTTVTVR